MNKLFLTGNEAAVLGAIDAGAKIMFGYPITPATEILQGWISKAEKNETLRYLQTEDEIAAGFGVVGAVLAGTKSFTASAGPGHILLQDPLAMAENLRIPFVGIMMQRGGPSTGTVNFSQQEVNLAAFGGNGDGLRIVYSAGSVAEMYEFTVKAFDVAWKYRFPTILLGDGYLGKAAMTVELDKLLAPVSSYPILKELKESTNLRNCYSSEADLSEVLSKNIKDWQKVAPKIAETEKFRLSDANEVIFAHGLVASACKDAILALRKQGRKIGLLRAKTLNPLKGSDFRLALSSVKRAFVIESSLNQFSRIVKYETAGIKTPIFEISKPAEGFTSEEIVTKITEGVWTK
ncbi:MAG: ferredoxin oxidoreductase [Patescibacteria group bacterium]